MRDQIGCLTGRARRAAGCRTRTARSRAAQSLRRACVRACAESAPGELCWAPQRMTGRLAPGGWGALLPASVAGPQRCKALQAGSARRACAGGAEALQAQAVPGVRHQAVRIPQEAAPVPLLPLQHLGWAPLSAPCAASVRSVRPARFVGPSARTCRTRLSHPSALHTCMQPRRAAKAPPGQAWGTHRPWHLQQVRPPRC